MSVVQKKLFFWRAWRHSRFESTKICSKWAYDLFKKQLVQLINSNVYLWIQMCDKWYMLRKLKRKYFLFRTRLKTFCAQLMCTKKKEANETAGMASLLHLLKTLNWRCALEAKIESRSWLLWLFSFFVCTLSASRSPIAIVNWKFNFIECFWEHCLWA